MRILHTLWSTNFGGIEKVVSDLSSAQRDDLGHWTGILVGQDGGELSKTLRVNCSSFHSLGLRSGRDFRIRKLREAMRIMSRYDLVHMHTYNPVLALAASRLNHRVIYTEHGNFGFGRRRLLSDRVKSILLRRFLNKHVASITYNSHFTRDVAKRRYSVPGVTNKVVYNGSSDGPRKVSPLPQALRKQLKGKFVVGTTSRFVGFKRVDRLIDAFAHFHQSRDTVLLLVGDGPLRQRLQRRVDAHGVATKTIFTGFQDRVRSFQNAMDVCVFPSENEPFGLVILECMALGKPTLGFSDGGGIVELIAPCFPDDIVDSCDDLVRRLVHHYEHTSWESEVQSSRVARAREFNIRKMATEMDDVYAAAMN